MARLDLTCDEGESPLRARPAPAPGVVVVFSEGSNAAPMALQNGLLELGRGTPHGAFEDDERVSRAHVRIGLSGPSWSIVDLGSRNGTYVNGQRVHSTELPSPPLVRIGRSLLLCVPDLTPYATPSHDLRSYGSDATAPVVGAVLRKAFDEIELAARASDTLLIQGESGAGKELAARFFHDVQHRATLGDAGAPFIALNCAAIPEGLAERLLFGAKRGAYSGAVADSEGYLLAAHRGSIFLDEIAELDLAVQAKLLRVLETREVLALGTTKPQRVELRVCAATHKDLREEVEARRFRQDLYFRIGRPAVRIPPLRERIDEIPRLIRRVLQGVDPRLQPSISLVEACALRPWPGNVRELLQELRQAGHAALGGGGMAVTAEHLPEGAGLPLSASGQPPPLVPRQITDEEIQATLDAEHGNVTRAARVLGMHRNQLRRWLSRRA
jgi:DNA-binding NtrC family response regulator